MDTHDRESELSRHLFNEPSEKAGAERKTYDGGPARVRGPRHSPAKGVPGEWRLFAVASP
jgi:hypothetical protein